MISLRLGTAIAPKDWPTKGKLTMHMVAISVPSFFIRLSFLLRRALHSFFLKTVFRGADPDPPAKVCAPQRHNPAGEGPTGI